MHCSEKTCLKRLVHDLEELKKFPEENIAAAPLEDNMLEWHCNIRQDEIIYHVILFFTKDYPSKSPSAEFVPRGFCYGGGATKPGKKGAQICLSIFSDFEHIHTEWSNDVGHGWSPAYTVKTILMNVISFLAENNATAMRDNYLKNLQLSKHFMCSDCGHCYTTPYPSLGVLVKEQENRDDTVVKKDDTALPLIKKPVIVDYFSKEQFADERQHHDNLFGYGLIVSGPSGRSKLTTPCEFLTKWSFNEMKATTGAAHSVLKERISFFLPLYINPNHGSHIRDEFEEVMRSLSYGVITSSMAHTCVEDMVLKTLPNLMCATLVYLFKEQTSENMINGYFAFHRLFLWALDTYPDLQTKVELTIKDFIENDRKRTKTECPDIGQWLMLLAASKQYHWQDVAEAYLNECWRRNVMWYVKDDSQLKDSSTSQEYRLNHTFSRTSVSRNLLAFQVVFLEIALPADMTHDQIVRRYDDNWGFPTEGMINTMKTECYIISNEIHTYADWYKILKLKVPSDNEIFKSLVDALSYSQNTNGYFFSYRR